MKRRPGPLAGRAEAARRAKAITIWNVLADDRSQSESLSAIRRDPRQLAFDFQQSGGMFQEQTPPRQRERRSLGANQPAGALPAMWQDGEE